jgi:hypothetical protein
MYEKAITKRFGPMNEDPMAELIKLMYESNMKEYQSQFKKLVTQLDITEAQYINMFVAAFLLI